MTAWGFTEDRATGHGFSLSAAHADLTATLHWVRSLGPFSHRLPDEGFQRCGEVAVPLCTGKFGLPVPFLACTAIRADESAKITEALAFVTR